MVEVFKTNVSNTRRAVTTVNAIHLRFQAYKANFDLEDIDKILRIESKNGAIKVAELLKFLKEREIQVEVLPD